MPVTEGSRTGERIATGIVALFFLGMGWLPLLDGGVSLRGKSGAVSYVTGDAALAVAAVSLLVAALTLLLFLRTFAPRFPVYAVAVAAVLLPPVLYMVL